MRKTPAGRFVIVAALTSVLAGAAPPDPLARARQLYNMGQYDAAITAARDAGRRPAFVDAAAIIVARAELERFRTGGLEPSLAAARTALAGIGGATLSPRDRVDLLVAWGEWSFLSNEPGVAAEMFESALSADQATPFDAHDRVLDWWAQSLDRLARAGRGPVRADPYRRILARMEQESGRHAASPVIPYWVAAAARGAGDLDRAWHAAQAGWIRSRAVTGGGQVLRADLDALVTEAIIPERARQEGSAGDARKAATEMRAQWDAWKAAWTPR